MTKLSVNINKIATLRNSRGGNTPDLLEAARNIERFGAQGITVHPRPDERHIRYADVRALKPLLATEFNIEGYPGERFIELVNEVLPAQVTLVPDGPDAITSNAGWDTLKNKDLLTEITQGFQQNGIRVSIFVDADPRMVEGAAQIGADRVELYTEAYATGYRNNREAAIAPFVTATEAAAACGLGLNAGHDLSLENLEYFADRIPGLLEVSIGHALISEALYLGLENTVRLYRQKLRNTER